MIIATPSPAPVRSRIAALVLGGLTAAALTGQLVAAGSSAAVTATKSELKGGQLKVEGQASPTVRVLVESTLSAASARADQNGLFKVQATGFSAPDCYLTIRDGRTPTATVRIPNCTPSITPNPPRPAPPTGSCVITPQPAATTVPAGADLAFWMYATGCAQPDPLLFTYVAGALPVGTYLGTFQNSTSGNIIGTPSIPGTYTFTVQARDGAGNTDQETFTIKVV